LLVVVDPWDETIESNWFAMLAPSRTSGFSCSRVELPLLSHPWFLTCSRVACCLAHALAYGIEPSRPLAKRFRSHSRTRRFNSAQTFGFCNFVVHPTCCDTICLPPKPSLLPFRSLARALAARTSAPCYSSSSS
jgi:hypothetical protein